MKGAILVTDTLFIYDRHEQQLRDAGYDVVRVEKPDSSEAELIQHLKGKIGYILGGTERVTEAVLESADVLRAIVFTGTGLDYIPGWQKAEGLDIRIGNTPYANVYEVAEWALAATLAMQRALFSLGPKGAEKFHTITSLPDLTIGVIGLGRIGKQYADMMHAIGAKEVVYWSRSDKQQPNYRFVADVQELLEQCDVVLVAVATDAGRDFIAAEQLSCMRDGALLVSVSHDDIVNEEDLSKSISEGKIRAAIDMVNNHELFKNLSDSAWYGSNSSAAYNSQGSLDRISDMAVETLVNLIETGEDQHRVV